MQLYSQLWEYFAIKVMHLNEGRGLFDPFGAWDTVGSQIGKHTHDLFSCVSLGKYVKELLTHTQQTYVH